jgi:hypothetical protein
METNGPALFGRVVLELMREQGIADTSELGLDALEASDGEKVRMALAFMGWSPQLTNA